MKEFSYPKSEIKILLAENIHPSGVEIFQRDGFKVQQVKKALTEEELLKEASDVHILGIRSKTNLTKKYFETNKKLLAVGCFCIGTNQVDLKNAKLSGVPVFNAPFSNTRSVAEMVLGEIVMLARRIPDRSNGLHKGKWDKSSNNCYEVRGKTLGIVGYGHIGSQVSVLAESFGLHVVYCDVLTKMPLGNSRQVSELKELLAVSDFVTLHVPETPATMNMIGRDQLSAMKKGSYLINASRGTVVDLDALKESILSKHLAGAAIDVFPEEPETNDQPFKSGLQELPNVILTPHLGGSTEEAQKNIGVEVASTLSKFINNGSTTGSVNFPKVELPTLEGRHRILNVHRNVPGVLKSINGIISDVGANIDAQFLATDPEIGYLIVDLNKELSEIVKQEIKKLASNIKTRILY